MRILFINNHGGGFADHIEVASETTYAADTGTKLEAYQRLGIREYFLFDPQGEFYHPTLRGYRLTRGRYAPIRPVEGAALPSRRLGVPRRGCLVAGVHHSHATFIVYM